MRISDWSSDVCSSDLQIKRYGLKTGDVVNCHVRPPHDGEKYFPLTSIDKINGDFLLGTVFSEAVNAYCRAHGLRYMPFVGQVTGRPSVLEGTAEEMVCEAKRCLAQGAYGIDLLGYRYTGDAPALNRALTAAVGPVCIAGSVNSYARLAEIRAAGAAYFTIGSAFFDHVFGDDFAAQIDAVCAYMEADHA